MFVQCDLKYILSPPLHYEKKVFVSSIIIVIVIVPIRMEKNLKSKKKNPALLRNWRKLVSLNSKMAPTYKVLLRQVGINASLCSFSQGN